MLVLRRRVGETIAIGGGIEIEVMEISRTRVKLGVTRAARHLRSPQGNACRGGGKPPGAGVDLGRT